MSYVKDPSAIIDYKWDWTGWLSTGETISTATVAVPTGIVKDSQSNTTTAVTVWLSGGTAGTRYPLVCRITTNQGRTDERTIPVDCRER